MGKKLKKLANTVLTGTEKARLGSQPQGSRGRSRTQEENIRFQRNVPDGGRYCDKEGIQPLPSSSNDEGSSHWTRPPIRCRGGGDTRGLITLHLSTPLGSQHSFSQFFRRKASFFQNVWKIYSSKNVINDFIIH